MCVIDPYDSVVMLVAAIGVTAVLLLAGLVAIGYMVRYMRKRHKASSLILALSLIFNGIESYHNQYNLLKKSSY